MSSEHVRVNYYIPALPCINYDELENHMEPRPEMHTLWIQLLWVLAMTLHICQTCNVSWEDDGPLIVWCYRCQEELV